MSTVAAGAFAPGHLGELTQIVPFEMVDAALESTRTVQARVRDLPSRVVVYLLLAAGLFAELGYGQVWARMVCALEGIAVASPTSSALAKARRRVGVKPLRELFGLVAGPAAGAVRWRGLLVCAVDATLMFVPDSPANRTVYPLRSAGHAMAGYPMLRLLTVVACGTRTVLDAVFGADTLGETTYAPRLARCLRPGMLLLADRGYDVNALVEHFAATGADLLFRCRNNRRFPAIEHLPDGSWLARIGATLVRIVLADIAVTCVGGPTRVQRYQLITTLTDHRRYPAADLVRLYHQRWEIETSYLELKSSMLGGRVLRARTPDAIAQEVYALLITYQALRTALADTALATGKPCDRSSFTIALNKARDQLIHAAGVIAHTVIDLAGTIGRAVLTDPLPARRKRISPRVVKRAISKHRAKGHIDRNSYTINIGITIQPG